MPEKNKLLSILQRIDIYGHELTFKHDDSFRYKTALGGVASILTGIFVIFVFSYFCQDLINKTNPAVRQTLYFEDNNYLNTTTFFFAMNFLTENNTKLQDPEKYLIFHAVMTIWDTKRTLITYTFSRCDKDKHFRNVDIPESRLNAKMKNFNDLYCMDVNQEIQLLNGFSDIPRQSIRVFVMECMNKTIDGIDYNGRCAPKEDIDKTLNSFMVNSFMYDSFLDTDDSLNSNKAQLKTDSISLSNYNGNCEKLFIGYIYSTATSDKGFIFEDSRSETKLKIVEYIPDGTTPTKDLNLDVNIAFWIEIYAKNTNSTTVIKFSKIQDVLANLGGVINFLKLVFEVAFMIINHYNISFAIFTKAEIYNESITVERKDLKEKISLQKELSEFRLNQTARQSSSRFPPTASPDRIRIERTSTNAFNTYKLKLGICRYWCTRLRNKADVNVKYMKIILDKVNKELEIKNFLRFKEDVYLMKTILFTAEETEIFNNRHDFRDICRVLEDKNTKYEGFQAYLQQSYARDGQKPDKITKFEQIIRNLKKKFTSPSTLRDVNQIKDSTRSANRNTSLVKRG